MFIYRHKTKYFKGTTEKLNRNGVVTNFLKKFEKKLIFSFPLKLNL